VTDADPETVTAWRSGLLIFDETPVAQVVAEINRYRAGRVVLLNDAIGRRQLTARVRTTETDLVIAEIKTIFGASARTLPGGIVLLT
jgi:transmembrane sensor